MKFKYDVKVFWSDEDNGWIAVSSHLPGCSAIGKSRMVALISFEAAAQAWAQAHSNAGNRHLFPHLFTDA